MASGKFPSGPPQLSASDRARVYDKTCDKIAQLYFDPKFRGVDWASHARSKRERVIDCSDPESFETAVHDVVRALGTSHTGFFHDSVRRVPSRLAIGATCVRADATATETRWVIRDVHSGGPAANAGLKPGDVIVAVNGREILTPGQPMFPMGTEATITIERQGRGVEAALTIPRPRSRQQPYSEPQSVVYSKLADSIGYVKVTILPGLIGIDVAKEIDDAFGSLRDCERLILDLRGHLGGGLGVLRLMSHLTPERIPIGYTLTRKSAERRVLKEDLPSLDRIPSSKFFGIVSLALRFGWRDPSVVLTSEGLGSKKCHGRVVILMNEGTVSAGEMVCAFARERRLATLVGMETAGRLIPGSGFKVGHGYLVIFPKAAYITWEGATFEGKGVSPDVEVPWSFEAYQQGRDNQLERALEVVSAL